jgi:LexA DNA binding domain-containing protein
VSHSAKAFTPKQGQYLAFIDAYTRVHHRPPAEWEMQRHFAVSPPSVHQMVLTLERAGLIRRQPGSPRSIEVLVPSEQTDGAQLVDDAVVVAPRLRSNPCIRPFALLLPANVGRPRVPPGEPHGLQMSNTRS